MNSKDVEILIVDDAMDMRLTLGRMLKNIGYTRISYASNEREAVAIARQTDVRFAFLDIEMPGKSGIELLKELHEIVPQCDCIMVSGSNDAKTVKQALEGGAIAFVIKPYSEQKISDVLEKLESAKPSGTSA